jgi:hypothetical protein
MYSTDEGEPHLNEMTNRMDEALYKNRQPSKIEDSYWDQLANTGDSIVRANHPDPDAADDGVDVDWEGSQRGLSTLGKEDASDTT